MAIEFTKWKYSEERTVESEWIAPIEGKRAFVIVDATYNPDEEIYQLSLKDIETGGVFPYRYWLNTVGEDKCTIVPNRRSRATLASLGFALAGEEVGIPLPSEILGLVVVGDNILKPSDNGKIYARIYKFFPACEEDVLVHSSNIEQYSVSADEFQ